MSDSSPSLDTDDFEELLGRSSLGAPRAGAHDGPDDEDAGGGLAGELAERFELVTRLGRGGEADTLLVRDGAGREAVLKIYRDDVGLDVGTGRALGGIASPHLVRLYESGESGGVRYELLEYVPGSTLADLARKPSPEALIVELVRQVSLALHALHGANIVHRDLKPANILVRSREPLEVAVADYGLSRQLLADAAFSNSGVTLPYTAPESLAGHVSPARDWWSLGMIVLELVTGRRPFEGLPPDFVALQLASRPVDLSAVPNDRLRVLCAGLLTRDPEYRWQFQQVQKWLSGSRPAAGRATAPRPGPSADPADGATLTWVQCQAASASIRAAQYAPEVLATVRPRGVLGILRSKGPLSLLLYVAAADGTLVWRGPDSLALLQPPGDRERKPVPGGIRMAVLRRLAHSWDSAIFVVPPVLLLALSGVAALLVAAGLPALAWPGVLLALAAMIHVTVLLVCGVVRGLHLFDREFGRRPPPGDEIAAELLPDAHWTITLCHHVDGTSAQQLLRRVQRRLEQLLSADVERAAAEIGVRVTDTAVTEQLVWLRGGTTTQATRDAVAAWSDRSRMAGPGRAFTLRMSDYRAVRPATRHFDRGGFLFWYLAGEALVILVLAQQVPQWERAVCGASCDGHPVTYGQALRWLAQRMFFTDPPELTPASSSAATIGWLVSVMSAMGVLVAVTAVRQYVKARRAEVAAVAQDVKRLTDRTRTLIMVATANERDAVLAAAEKVTGRAPEATVLGNQVLWQLGTISATQVMLVQVEPGAVGPGAAAVTAAALVSQLDLDFFLLVGICYGLRPEHQEFGDILVCEQLHSIEHRKETEPRGEPLIPPPQTGAEAAARLRDTPAPEGPRTVLVRGDSVTPSVALLSRFHALEHSWSRPPAVHFGPMLSASLLVSSRSLRDELAYRHPDAIGGEMEGAGVYAAAAHAKVDWIVVKAISDWGFGKSDKFHDTAARNAANFVIRAAELGLLDEAPARGRL